MVMNIGLDFDGVIADCGDLKSSVAKQMYEVNIPPGRFKKDWVVPNNWLTFEQYQCLQKLIYETEEVGLRIQPVPGALMYIPQLLSEGHTVKIVTSRAHKGLMVAKSWLQKHELDIQIFGCGYGETKAAACAGLDIYLDDDLDKLEPLVEVVPCRYLFSWEYNQHVDTGSTALRITSWVEFYSHLHTLETEFP